MRMVCDTPAILDPTCRISPKLEELEGVLGDLLDEPDRKVIVFSEWERMLTMIRELAGEMGVDAVTRLGEQDLVAVPLDEIGHQYFLGWEHAHDRAWRHCHHGLHAFDKGSTPRRHLQ